MTSVYIAILTQGSIRKELALSLLKWRENSKYDWFIEFTEEQPIEHCRNNIVKKFLASDKEFLLMIDSDVIPERNPLELIEKNLDIVSCPAPIYQYRVIWNCYKLNEEGYWLPIDISKEKDSLIDVDATGSGCILIKRNVLEQIKAPFERLFDEDGLEKMGLDLYFSKKAKEKGFKIFVSTLHKCSHFKIVDLQLF
jgi:hypothetical protein